MHKSVSVKGKDGRYLNNERLEFLGDAILDAVVGDVVYRHFENKREGFLTNARSKLVQRETLGKLAVEIGLDKLIQSNQTHSNSHNSYMAGNAFEALVGAIYLDYGYDRCMKFMEKRILNHVIDVDKTAYREVNFKSKLLEWSQKNRIRLDFKDLHQSSDKDGVHMFNTLIVIEGLDCGRGKGYSKKESQQRAAQETLIMLKKQKGFEESVFEAKSRRTAMEEQPEALLPEIPDEVLTAKVKADVPTKTDKKEQSAARKNNERPVDKKEQSAARKNSERPADKKEQPASTSALKKNNVQSVANSEQSASTPVAKNDEQSTTKKEQVPAPKKDENESSAMHEVSFDSVDIALKESVLPVEVINEGASASVVEKSARRPKKQKAPVRQDKDAQSDVSEKQRDAVKQDTLEKQGGAVKQDAPAKKEKMVKHDVPAQQEGTGKLDASAQQEGNGKSDAKRNNEKSLVVKEGVGEVDEVVKVETETDSTTTGKPKRQPRKKPAKVKQSEKNAEESVVDDEGAEKANHQADKVEAPVNMEETEGVEKNPSRRRSNRSRKKISVEKEVAQPIDEFVVSEAVPAEPVSEQPDEAASSTPGNVESGNVSAKPKRRGSRRKSSSLGSAAHPSN